MFEVFASLAKEEEAAVSEEESFAALVRRQSLFVFRVAYSILRNAHDAEDVVQETFLKLYRLRAWKSMEDERAFLSRMAWRIALDQRRRNGKRSVEPDISAANKNAEQMLIETDRNALVWRLIDALPDDLRQPLALSTVEEMTSLEIANAMGIPEGTVRTRLMRARQILKQKLEALLGAPK
jgi:RNA polymerase sigma-70 factor (ECF subfamily)